MKIIKNHRELRVYQKSFEKAMQIFHLSKEFPKEETYSLTDQIRRSSRSVCSNIAEAFRRRKYPKAFSSKLNESEAETAETQNWLDFALNCEYIDDKVYKELDLAIEGIPLSGGYVFAIWANRAFSLVRFFFATEKEMNKHLH